MKKLGQIRGKWHFVGVSGEFESTEFELVGFFGT